eukprot:XP_011672823.1 PREDICTED: uncharacterized protein LOC105442431 [Strongylocentrotus purpuratus]
MTEQLWSSLRSHTPHNKLTISDSSLRFPSSPPELPSVTKLVVERVTSNSYEGLLSSLPGLKEVDITIGDANKEDISVIQTSIRRNLTTHNLIRINPHPFVSEGNSPSLIRGLGLLITDCKAILSGVVFGPKVKVVDRFQPSTRLMSANLFEEKFSWLLNSDEDALHTGIWRIKDCQLSTKMTVKLWSCLRSFNSLNHLNISDSSLSFPPYPPELPSVLKLSAEKVTSQSYKGVISSLPRLRVIDITIDDAERDIPQIMAGLRRSYTGGQRLAYIKLTAPSSLPLEKKRVRSETMKKLGLLIREQTKNLQRLDLLGVKGTGEEDLVYLIESCRLVKSMSFVL